MRAILVVVALAIAPVQGAVADNLLDSPVTASFVQALSQYYGIPQREVIVVHDRGIPEEELPVVFTVARHAHVQPVEVVELRSSGLSWNDIFGRYRLSPTIFTVPGVPDDYGPPYGHAYGYWRNHPHPTVVYSDDDYIHFGNTYFLHRYHHAPAREIIRLRQSRPNYLVINDSYWHRRGHRERPRAIVIERTRGHESHGRGHERHEEHQNRGHGHRGGGHGRGHGHHGKH